MSDKYPSTPYLEFAPGNNDFTIESKLFLHKRIVITEKIDGSNVCIHHKECYARTHSSAPKHPSFDAFKALHANLLCTHPKLLNVFTHLFGEWCYAKHSISYDALPNYLVLFGVRMDGSWWSWEGVVRFAKALDIPTVPVLYQGVVASEAELEQLVNQLRQGPSECGAPEKEGVVVRLASSFLDNDFSQSVAKWVRPGHVQDNEHWKHKEIIRNKLRENKT